MNAGYRGSQRDRAPEVSRRSGARGGDSSRHAQSPVEVAQDCEGRALGPARIRPVLEMTYLAAQRLADSPAFLVAVFAHTPAARNQVHRQQPELPPNLYFCDVGAPALELFPHAQRLQVSMAAVVDSPADREPGRQMPKAGRRPFRADGGLVPSSVSRKEVMELRLGEQCTSTSMMRASAPYSTNAH